MKKLTHLFCGILLFSAMAVSCSEEETSNGYDDSSETSAILPPQPTSDEIRTLFDGKTFFGDVNDRLIQNFILPRISNMSDSIEDSNLQFIVLPEKYAETILANENLFNSLKRFWNRKKALGFFEPGKSSLTLIYKLRNYDYSYTPEITDDMVENFKNIKLFITNVEGKSYVRERYDVVQELVSEAIIMEEDSVETTEQNAHQVEIAMSDYHLGQIAEEVCLWLKENIQIDDESDPALVRAISSFDYASNAVSSVTWSKNLTIDYDEVGSYHNSNLTPRTITRTMFAKVTGGYSQEENADIYDVAIVSKFPVSQIYYWNIHLKTYGLFEYKDKFTGKCYTGPIVEFSLDDASGNKVPNTKIYSPVPQVENHEITTTHYPATAEFGTSLSGGISTSGPEASVGLSSTFSLPYDVKTQAYKEMKFNYSESGSYAKWQYYHDGYWIYDWTKGLNGRPDHAYEAATNDKDFEFLFTYRVDDSKSLGEKNLYLNAIINDEIYSEYCTPDKHTRYRKWWTSTKKNSLLLPVVYRYFGQFRPNYYSGTTSINDDDWVNLSVLLEGNPNYRALSDETISVGSRVEITKSGRSGVEEQAERIWTETIESLVKQNNGHVHVSGEFVVGLYGGTNKNDQGWLKKGLHVKGKEWKLVNDVTEYENLSPDM